MSSPGAFRASPKFKLYGTLLLCSFSTLMGAMWGPFLQTLFEIFGLVPEMAVREFLFTMVGDALALFSGMFISYRLFH